MFDELPEPDEYVPLIDDEYPVIDDEYPVMVELGRNADGSVTITFTQMAGPKDGSAPEIRMRADVWATFRDQVIGFG